MLDSGVVVNNPIAGSRISTMNEIKIRYIEPQFVIILEQLEKISNKEEKFKILRKLINLTIQPQSEVNHQEVEKYYRRNLKASCYRILKNTPCDVEEKRYIYRALMVLLEECRFNKRGIASEWTLQSRLQRNGHHCTADEIEVFFLELVQQVYAEKYDGEQNISTPSVTEQQNPRETKRKRESTASTSTSDLTSESRRSVRARIDGEDLQQGLAQFSQEGTPGNIPHYEISFNTIHNAMRRFLPQFSLTISAHSSRQALEDGLSVFDFEVYSTKNCVIS